MISKLSKRIVRMLYAESMLEIEDVELYEYGFYVIFTYLLFFCFSAICGLILGVPLEAVLFYVAFSSIRTYAGGIHAKTETACMGLTAVAIVLSVCAIRIFSVHSHERIIGCMLLFGTVTVMTLAPLDSPEKPLESNEKKQYRCISTLILIGLVAATGLAAIFKLRWIGNGIAVGLTLEGILLTVGRICLAQKKGRIP